MSMMPAFKVDFYEDATGVQPVRAMLLDLRDKSATSKDARIQYQKILLYIRVLETYGTRAGEPYMKHLGGKLWELRPLTHRIVFAFWHDDKFVLLHHFVKKTKKTPKTEIEQAERNLKDFLERNE